MSLQARLAAFITAVGADIKALYARPTHIFIDDGSPVPPGTPEGTLIARPKP